jgi:hypothetical protein
MLCQEAIRIKTTTLADYTFGFPPTGRIPAAPLWFTDKSQRSASWHYPVAPRKTRDGDDRMTGWIKGGPESVWFRRLFGSFLAAQKEHRTTLNLLSQKKWSWKLDLECFVKKPFRSKTTHDFYVMSGLKINSRQRSTLPAGRPTSTIDAERLNCCVRDGNRWFPLAIVTEKLNSYFVIRRSSFGF